MLFLAVEPVLCMLGCLSMRVPVLVLILTPKQEPAFRVGLGGGAGR